MAKLVLLFLPLVAGFLLAFQLAVESKNRVTMGGLMPIAVIAFFVAFVFSLFCMWLLECPFPTRLQIASSDWQLILLGGIIRVAYLACMIYAMKPWGLGKPSMISISAQLIGMIAIDHNGWLGAEQRKMDDLKILGCVLVMIGIVAVLWRR